MTAPIHVAASNIHGLGASQLVQSLLPALAKIGRERIGTVFVPETGPLASLAADLGLATAIVRRRLPNALSRVVECLASSHYYPVAGDMLVLGDVPLAVPGKQILLVHRPHMVSGADTGSVSGNAKVAVSRWLFRQNAPRVYRAIVQSSVMADGLRDNFPELGDRIRIIPQPAPQWLKGPIPTRGAWDGDPHLRLFYPASPYPHKNHELLKNYASQFGVGSGVEIVLTLDPLGGEFPPTLVPIGLQDCKGMCEQYAATDALIFPSLDESFGLPLVEAMTLRLPILAADRPYARSLCGDAAIYFDPSSAVSLNGAITELRQRLMGGWTPDYAAGLASIPCDWDEVARQMVALFGNGPLRRPRSFPSHKAACRIRSRRYSG